MIAVISLCYGLVVWLFFAKLKLVKPRPTSIAVAGGIGIVLIGGVVVAWQFSAPYTKQLVVMRFAVQIVPQVKGPIEKLHAKPLAPLKKGQDILFQIQEEPFQYVVDQLTADLAVAEQNVLQAEAGIRAAEASTRQSEASLLAAKADLAVAQETQRLNPNAIAELEVTRLTQQEQASTAAVEQAQAATEQAKFGWESAKERVVSVQAQLKTAEFNLAQCTVRAPADGFIANWQAREGTMTTSIPLAAVGTFVDTTTAELVAVYPQNTLKLIRIDDPVEIALKSRPGEVLTGKVLAIVQATGEGQLTTSGQLPSVADVKSSGMLAVKIQLDDPDVVSEVVMGSAGTAAVYTNRGKPFHIISRVVVRMQAWLYYLIPA